MLFLKSVIIFIFFSFSLIYCPEHVYSAERESKVSTIVELHYERGIRFYKQGEYDNAVSELERVLELEPEHTKAKKIIETVQKRKNKNQIFQLYDEANKYYKQREYQKALDIYTKVLEILPSDSYSLFQTEIIKDKIQKLEERSKKKEAKH